MVGNEALLCAFDLLLEMWKAEHPEIPARKIPALIIERNLYGIVMFLTIENPTELSLKLIFMQREHSSHRPVSGLILSLIYLFCST